jgi:superfamily II DNA or RNA helicase
MGRRSSSERLLGVLFRANQRRESVSRTRPCGSRAMAELRPYQVNITAEFHSRRAAGVRLILLVAPKGSRKRIIAASIGKSAVAAGQRVMVIARRREIIEQTARKLRDNGIDPGIIQAGFGDDPLAVVQVASVQTLHRNAIRGTQLALEDCHHATARTWRAVIEAYPGAVCSVLLRRHRIALSRIHTPAADPLIVPSIHLLGSETNHCWTRRTR